MALQYMKWMMCAAVISWGICSCTAPIDINTENSAQVVVIYGTLTDEYAHQTISVTKSAPYFSDSVDEVVSGAVVSVTSSDGESYAFKESSKTPGTYLSTESFAVVAGVTYTMHVSVDQDETSKVYETTSTAPDAMELDSIKIDTQEIVGRLGYGLYLYGNEPSTTDYYVCEAVINDSLYITKLSQVYLFNDKLINGQYMNGLLLAYWLDVKYKSDYDEEEQAKRVFVKSGDKVDFAIMRIEKGYYDFVSQAQEQINGENPFFGGSASNITTNIPDGVGYFTAYCKRWYRAYVP